MKKIKIITWSVILAFIFYIVILLIGFGPRTDDYVPVATIAPTPEPTKHPMLQTAPRSPLRYEMCGDWAWDFAIESGLTGVEFDNKFKISYETCFNYEF